MESWDQEMRAAVAKLTPAGSLTGATRELQAGLGPQYKLLLPHTYRTMGDQPKATGGIPGKYRNVKLEQAELYDLKNDPEILDINFADIPVMQVNISGDYDLNRLKNFADDAKDRLESLKEIKKVLQTTYEEHEDISRQLTSARQEKETANRRFQSWDSGFLFKKIRSNFWIIKIHWALLEKSWRRVSIGLCPEFVLFVIA